MLPELCAIIFSFDKQDCFTRVNKRFEDFFLMQSDALIGKSIHDILPHDFVASLIKKSRAIKSDNESQNFISTLQLRNQSYILEVVVSAVSGDDGANISNVIAFEAIPRIDDETQEWHMLFRDFIESSSVGIMILDSELRQLKMLLMIFKNHEQ